ncbi:hypothetical protein BKA69DRAFT_580752 [Paraphysoderma sedebokerense]|nr:hypothetical protein BKA69DRAFT_580752 [Paraphysoderma sedebokerense]
MPRLPFLNSQFTIQHPATMPPKLQTTHNLSQQTQNNQTIDNIRNTQKRITSLEKELYQFLCDHNSQSRNHGEESLSDVYGNYVKEGTKDLDKYKSKWEYDLNRLKEKLHELQRMTTQQRRGGKFLASLQSLIEDIEFDIVAFKEWQIKEYESLHLSEKLYTNDLSTFQDRFKSWQSTNSKNQADNEVSRSSCGATRPKSLNRDLSGLLPEVIAYQNYLAKYGGVYGHWDEIQHLRFLRLRQKIGANSPKFTGLCAKELDLSFDEVKQHEDWYRVLLRLQNSKKEALKRWKIQKEKRIEAEKSRIEKELEEQNRCQVVEGLDIGQNVQDKKSLEKRKELKEKIKLWKERKLKAESQHQLEEERKRKEEHQREQQKREQQQATIKSSLEEYKTLKALKEREELQRKKLEEQEKQVDPETLKQERERLLSKNQELLVKRQDLIEQKHAPQKLRKQIQDKIIAKVGSTYTASADPNRIYRATKVHSLREQNDVKENDRIDRRTKSEWSVNSLKTLPRRFVMNFDLSVSKKEIIKPVKTFSLYILVSLLIHRFVPTWRQAV